MRDSPFEEPSLLWPPFRLLSVGASVRAVGEVCKATYQDEFSLVELLHFVTSSCSVSDVFEDLSRVPT